MHELTLQILQKAGVSADIFLKRKIRGLSGITTYQLVYALLDTDSLVSAALELGYTENPVKEAARKLSSLLNIGPSHLKWRTKLLSTINYKWCNTCDTAKLSDLFTSSKNTLSGLDYTCKACRLINSKKHKLYIVDRTPNWADLEEISKFYNNCPVGYHVDHIIPLRGTLVSGLHVIDNLQYLTEIDNKTKSNTFNIVA